MSQDLDRGFQLGAYEIHPLDGTIEGPAGAKHVQHRVMQVLTCLAASAGQTVDRQTIMDRVWSDSVVGDEALNRCISEIRAALDDDSASPKYVQTIPRIGYRLIPSIALLDEPGPAIARRKPSLGRRRLMLGALIIVVALVALSMYFRDLIVGESFELSSGDTLVITALKNGTDNPLLDDSLLVALRIALNQTKYFRVVPESRINAALRRMQAPAGTSLSRSRANEVAVREGFNVVLVAEIVAVGDGYTIGVEIVDPVTDDTLLARAVSVEGVDDLLPGLDLLARNLRQALGESLVDIESNSAPLERVTTPNLEALRAYSLALAKQNEGRPEEAITLLERALQLDPEFATAHATLGTYLSNLSQRPGDVITHWDRAIELKNRLTERENLYIEGARSMMLTADDMREAWLLFSTLYPNDPVGHSNLGSIYWFFFNDLNAAEQSFVNAARLDGQTSPIGLYLLATIRMGQGRLDESVADFEGAMEIGNNPVNSAYAEALIAGFRYDEAETFLETTGRHTSASVRDWSSLKLANLYLDRGRLADALATADHAVQVRQDRDRSLHEALAYRVAILERSADRAAFEAALNDLLAVILDDLDQPVYALAERPVIRAAMLGKIAARNGLRALATEVIRRLEPYVGRDEFPLREPAVNTLRAELLMLDERAPEAVALLRTELEHSHSDLYHLRETLARACAAAGDIECAREQFTWIHDNRGRAFVEWYDDFFAKAFNVADWGAATLALARLAESAGDVPSALTYYRMLLNHWTDADPDMPFLIEARRGAERLAPDS